MSTADEERQAAELLALIEMMQQQSYVATSTPVRVTATTPDGEPVL